MRAKVSSLGFKGIYQRLRSVALALCLTWAGLAVPVGAQTVEEMPVLFDARERLVRPDVSGLLRLRFLTTTDFPPFNFIDQTGRLSGFHVDLARTLCAELGVEARCQIQALPFSELQSALEGGQGEIVMAGVAVSPELRAEFLFSRPYMLLPARFVRNRDVALSAPDASALFNRPVGVIGGTAHEAMLKAYFPNVTPVILPDRAAMLDAVKAKAVDAAFADGLQLSFWASGPASEGCCELFDGPYLSQDYLGEGMMLMMRSGDTVLKQALNSALAAVSRDGRLQEIYLKYFPVSLY